MNESKRRRATSSGEGERRAVRGLTAQYGTAAGLIYERICSNELIWVGLADRSAGSFDDLVLGLAGKVIGFQIKSSRDPTSVGLKTLLLGADNLLGRFAGAWQRLRRESPESEIELSFVTDDFPRTSDNLSGKEERISSAAFYRNHQANRKHWTRSQWKESKFGEFWIELQKSSALTEEQFDSFWRSITFKFGGNSSRDLPNVATIYDRRRIDDLASLLPRLVADIADKDRWTTAEIISRLRWVSPTGVIHPHIFPVDSAVRSNRVTEEALFSAFESIDRGYIALLGPPGSGKSTLLQAGLFPTPRASILRYLAFVPDEGHGLGRAEAIDFLHDIVTQLTRQNLRVNIFPGTDLTELRSQLAALLLAAGERYNSSGIKTIIIVDGLDHIPREERPNRSLLSELPLPHALPCGVVFVLGTQRLYLDEMPTAVSDQANEDGRRFDIAPLSRESIFELADLAGLPADVDRIRLYTASGGHPLSARYLIAGLSRADESEREKWLSDAPPGNDVNAYYQRAWHDLASNAEAQRALAYVALVEGAIASIQLDNLAGSHAVDAAWQAASHLLRIDNNDGISIFHNSFRLFLLEKTSIRLGKRDETLLRRRYSELAEMAKRADDGDPQRWLELRYRARANDTANVIGLATPEYFRKHFFEKRNPGDIHDDIRLAFQIAGQTRNSNKLFELILARHEIEVRTEAICSDALLDAYIATNDLNSAHGLATSERVDLSVSAEFGLVDALLSAGDTDEARKLIEFLEPTNKLYGAEAIDGFRIDDELREWARRVLVFRAPRNFLAALERLRADEGSFRDEYELADVKNDLKFAAARALLEDRTAADFPAVVAKLNLEEHAIGPLRILCAEAARDANDDESARAHLRELKDKRSPLSEDLRRRAALVAVRSGELELARRFLENLPAPVFTDEGRHGPDWGPYQARAILTHAQIETQLCGSIAPRQYPGSPLQNAFQRSLESVGALIGSGYSGKAQSPEVVWSGLKNLITFIRYPPRGNDFESGRWEIDKTRSLVAGTVVRAAEAHGSAALHKVLAETDSILLEQGSALTFIAFRRAYTLAAFAIERNTKSAIARLDGIAVFGEENTPQEYVQNVAEAAELYARVGDKARARELLQRLYRGTLGVIAPARKDGQYELWRDVYQKACLENPAGRELRVRFFNRLLDGLSQTEGRGAARRVATDHLIEAAQCRPELACAVSKSLRENGLVTWPKLLGGTLKGLVRQNSTLAIMAERIFSRLALPFMDEFYDSILTELFTMAPTNQKQTLLEHAADCLGLDADVAIRSSLLTQLQGAATATGYEVPISIVERSKKDRLDKPIESDRNPYEGVSSLDELRKTIETADEDKKYFAIRTFERLAPVSEYLKVKELFDLPIFATDERAILATGLAAVAAGDRAYAEKLCLVLSSRAEERGSWGRWQSGTKLRLHSLLVALGGEEKRKAAFDALSEDLARGREWTGSLLPDLTDVFELLSPRPTWADMWEILVRHLEQFREYEIGKEISDGHIPSEAALIADLIFSALDFSVDTLSWQSRLCARELVATDCADDVLLNLIDLLNAAGADRSVDAIRIAWEVRESKSLRESIKARLVEWISSDDLAVIYHAELLSKALGVEIDPSPKPLPGYYSLEFPPDERASDFEVPSGFSSSTSGLWTESPHSWTWPLERSLKLLVSASHFDISVLRRRAGEFMRRNGGRSSFGPEIEKERMAMLRRLDLELTYRRLPVMAAFRAVRQVCAELFLAGNCQQDAVPFLLAESGGFAERLPTSAPTSRPEYLRRSEITREFLEDKIDAWLANAAAAAQWPAPMKDVLVAADASFDQMSFRREISEERLFLFRDKPLDGEDLDQAEWQLPRIKLIGGMVPLYDGIAQGGVACVTVDSGSSIPENLLLLCPRLARTIGLTFHPDNPFAFVDEHQSVVVQTVWWRDGGVARRGGERSTRGQGCVISATAGIFKLIKPYVGSHPCVHVWRHATSDERPTTRKSRNYSVAL